jgi:hypothetical protein
MSITDDTKGMVVNPHKKFAKLSTKEEDIKLVNHLCSLPVLVTWPRVLFEIVNEYCHNIPPICYVFGGVNLSKMFSTCGRIVDGEWTYLPSTLSPRYLCAASRVGEYIYVTGGKILEEESQTKVERLHIPTLQWSTTSPLPEPRRSHACVTVGDTFYCIGGDDGQQTKNSVYRYETTNGNGIWTLAASMHHSRSSAACVVLNKCIYVFGGEHRGDSDIQSSEMYNVTNNHWSDIAEIPQNRSNATAVALNDNTILLLGGQLNGVALDIVDEYSIATNCWRRLSWALPGSRSCFASWYDASTDALYIALGRPSYNSCNIYVSRPVGSGNWVMMKTCAFRFGFGWCT